MRVIVLPASPSRLTLLLLAPALLCAQTVSGRVVNALTGEPIRRASVIFMRGDGVSAPFATSDGEGRFTLQDLPPGNYRPSVSRNGFVPSGPVKLVALAAGQSITDLTLKLTPESIVTGRVVDEEGEPMRNLTINLESYRYIQGRKQLLSTGGTSSTNDLGEYRVFGVAPGQYYLSATLSGRQVITGDEGYVTTYYPGTIDASAATPIRVQPGAQLRGVDLALTKTRTFHVNGRVTHGMQGRPNVSIVQLSARGNGRFVGMRVSPVDASGAFHIPGVSPGAYTLSATFNDSTGARRAHMTIEVGRGDIDGLTLAAMPDVTVKGRIVSDPDAPPVPLSNARIVLQPRELDGYSGGSAQGKPDEQGDFEIRNTLADRYLLSVSGLPAGAYVKSARTELVDVLAEGLDLSTGAAPLLLTIVISPRGATVSGSVEPAGATVVLIPKGNEHRALSVTANAAGAFSMTGVPPGEYKVYAWEDVGGEAWLDTDFVKPFESKGEPMTVREGEQKTLTLKAIPAEN